MAKRANASFNPNPHVTICHAKPADTAKEGYNEESPNTFGALNGHITQHDADIIPPFVFGLFHYAGKNWTDRGEAIWDNECEIPEELKTPVCTDKEALNYEPEFNEETMVSDDKVCEYQKVDICPNLDGEQESLPDGYHFETIDDVRMCIQDPPPPVVETHQDLTPASPPVCSDGNILALPIAFTVIRQGDIATLTWYKTGGNLVNIYYKEVGASDWTHAVGDVPNVDPSNKFVIRDLNPNLGYTFAIEQHQGCAGGQRVQSVVVDGASYLPVIFKFSYWTWGK